MTKQRSLMPRSAAKAVACLLFAFAFGACPLGPPPPQRLIIDDFTAHDVNQPPGGDWTRACITTYDGAYGPNSGVIVVDSPFGNNRMLNLMFDIFGPYDSFGQNCTGYAYAQKPFHAPAAGKIDFTFRHIGYNGVLLEPTYALEFWLQPPDDLSVASPRPAADWINTTETIDFTPSASRGSIPVSAAGDYLLTWRVWKGGPAYDYEDNILIDDIVFTSP